MLFRIWQLAIKHTLKKWYSLNSYFSFFLYSGLLNMFLYDFCQCESIENCIYEKPNQEFKNADHHVSFSSLLI